MSRPTTPSAALLAALTALAACGDPQTVSRGALPAAGQPPMAEHVEDGTCRARDVQPAIYEHVMGEVQVVQAEIAEDGTVIRPPIYRKAPVPRVVRERGEITFQAPCPEQMTPEFIASVQRALAARGYFAGNVTGTLDAPTTAAVRAYQSERGLKSAQLSLETARALGLVAVELPPRDTGDAAL
ncbi:putative peptidoglycan binding domain protein [Antarctobacter heliothermus]|uniref:Putative peptidoglycan binding domain protein n=1 Tax=Antarctobacter heliothermus TaxID=74033 RepID=A0A222E9T4_9RHOB|nr:peptidoglycan-binding domain-containing protein [Antarctobacter heliothermus]ASP22840.1 putative peptidoglycan binding domain protein [Antarctobacter heliothermus]